MTTRAWKNWVELGVGTVGTLVVSSGTAASIHQQDWGWVVSGIIGVFMFVRLTVEAWKRI